MVLRQLPFVIIGGMAVRTYTVFAVRGYESGHIPVAHQHTDKVRVARPPETQPRVVDQFDRHIRVEAANQGQCIGRAETAGTDTGKENALW